MFRICGILSFIYPFSFLKLMIIAFARMFFHDNSRFVCNWFVIGCRYPVVSLHFYVLILVCGCCVFVPIIMLFRLYRWNDVRF